MFVVIHWEAPYSLSSMNRSILQEAVDAGVRFQRSRLCTHRGDALNGTGPNTNLFGDCMDIRFQEDRRTRAAPLFGGRCALRHDAHSSINARFRLSIDHDLKRLRKLCPSSNVPWTGATLPTTFSRVRLPTLRDRMRNVFEGTFEPSAST